MARTSRHLAVGGIFGGGEALANKWLGAHIRLRTIAISEQRAEWRAA